MLWQHPYSIVHRRRSSASSRASLPDFQRSPENRANGNDAGQLVGRDCGQSHGRDASARAAVRVTAELTGDDLGLQIRRQNPRGQRKNTILRTSRRLGELLDRSFGHIELGESPAQFEHFSDRTFTLMRVQNLWRAISCLRRKNAEPDFLDLGSRGPELQKFPQVPGTFHHLTRDRAVYRNALAGDVRYDPIVG